MIRLSLALLLAALIGQSPAPPPMRCRFEVHRSSQCRVVVHSDFCSIRVCPATLTEIETYGVTVMR